MLIYAQYHLSSKSGPLSNESDSSKLLCFIFSDHLSHNVLPGALAAFNVSEWVQQNKFVFHCSLYKEINGLKTKLVRANMLDSLEFALVVYICTLS